MDLVMTGINRWLYNSKTLKKDSFRHFELIQYDNRFTNQYKTHFPLTGNEIKNKIVGLPYRNEISLQILILQAMGDNIGSFIKSNQSLM